MHQISPFQNEALYKRLAGLEEPPINLGGGSYGHHPARPATLTDASNSTCDQAEKIYAGCGLVLGTRLVTERKMTQVERRALVDRYQQLAVFSPEREALQRAHRRGLMSAAVVEQNNYGATDLELPSDDETTHRLAAMHPSCPYVQPSVDLAASGVAVIRYVDCGRAVRLLLETFPGQIPPLWMRNYGAENGHEVVVFVRAETLPEGSARCLDVEFDADGTESYHARHDVKIVPLPCLGSLERWISERSNLYDAAANVVDLLRPRPDGLAAKLGQWLRDNFTPLPADSSGSKGLQLKQIHALCLEVNGWTSDVLSSRALADAIGAEQWIEKKRSALGMRYLVQRKPDSAPVAIERVAIDSIDPIELEQFRAWKLAQDTPERRARKAREQAERDHAREVEAERVRMWGHRPQVEVVAIVEDHQRRERARKQACALAGTDFMAVPPYYGVPHEGNVPAYSERLAAFLAERATAANGETTP